MCFSPKENVVYVADTYNHKVKRIDVATNECETCNFVEESKNIMTFNEPGGLCLDPTGTYLYVANTNNHTIDVVDLSTKISKPLKISFNTNPVAAQNFDDEIVKLMAVRMNSRGGELKINVTLNLSSGICFTTGAPQKWVAHIPEDRWSIKSSSGSDLEHQPLCLELSVSSGNLVDMDNVKISFRLNLCATDVCFSKRFSLQIPVAFSDDDLESVKEDVSINVSRDSVQVQL